MPSSFSFCTSAARAAGSEGTASSARATPAQSTARVTITNITIRLGAGAAVRARVMAEPRDWASFEQLHAVLVVDQGGALVGFGRRDARTPRRLGRGDRGGRVRVLRGRRAGRSPCERGARAVAPAAPVLGASRG